MDFHSLTRRQLQALCKKNKIPANITNLAMADSLQALPFVEGIEELLLKPSESAASPPQSQVRVPRTGTRGTTTTTRLKTRGISKEDESETLTTARTTRSSTRRLALESPAPNKMAHQTSSSSTNHARKMEETLLFNVETQEEDEQKENPPTIVPRSLEHQHNNSSRSANRLAENNALEVKLKERSESVELFSDSNLKEDSAAAAAAESDHPPLEISQQGFRNSSYIITSESLSGSQSDNFEIDGDEDRDADESIEIRGAGDDRCDYYESNTELLCTKNKTEEEEAEALEDNNTTTNEEMECNDDSAAAQLVVDRSSNSLFSVENTTPAAANLKTTKSEEEESMLESSNCKDLGMSNDDIMNSASLKEEGKKYLNEENEMQESKEDVGGGAAAPTDILKDDDNSATSEDLVVQKSSTDHSVLAFYMGVESDEYQSDPRTEQAAVHITTTPALQEISSGGYDDGEEAAFADNLAKKFIAMELDTTSSAPSQHTYGISTLGAPDFEVEPPSGDINVLPPPDSSENSSQDVAAALVPTSNSSSTSLTLTSIMKESLAPPSSSSQKAAIPRRTPPTKRMMMALQVSDNKENIITHNSATKQLIHHHPIPEKDKKEKKQTGKALDEISLRQLTKMLKEKLEISKKMNINDNTTANKEGAEAAATERPALQALSDNALY